ncbi:penicillin-binding protein 2 [uncultured Eubacterium sp.]|uniref:peptidoglycan D,D-transpeptidase FtsI family protein n=1 Tax=uncultured Eubacterium sp. TaxID=165185 RepID=UPI002671B01C|nr:penicillin-binding transpeptidase domain-containing protein [uncultured Eubacterium sp.]
MSQREIQPKSEKPRTRRKSKSTGIEKKKLNRQAMVTTIVISVIFIFMIGYYAYFIIVDSPKVLSNSSNKRIDSKSSSVIRGTIYSKNGKKLAYTDTKGTDRDLSDDTREYPYGKTFAHAVGITTHGKYGLEKMCNFDLLSSENNALSKIINDFTNTTEMGCDVHTTLSVGIQKSAYNVLDGYKGAVFVMNPDTGEIYAMASRPSYDPMTIDDIWDELVNDPKDSRLVNRATQGKYIPGSVFKIVTTLEYMRENKNYNNFKYYCDGSAKFGGFTIKCFDGNSHHNEDLKDAFAYSCNSAFSTIGDKLKVLKYKNTAEQLMFNEALPLDMDYNQSVFPLTKSSTQFDITQTSIGQGKTTVSPAHMAMIASAIANNGVLMKPYIIDYIENSSGNVVKLTKQQEYKRLMKKSEAEQLKEYMHAVCEYGTGRVFSGANYQVYGKTGTAEVDKNDNVNSWFVGYAKKGKKKLAIAVVIENMHEGSTSATNCAKEVLDSYFD